MTTATDDRKPDQNILATAEACDHLSVVVHKLRAVEAAARSADSGAESEGVAWILAEAWREVEEIMDLVGGVNARLRENGSGGAPGSPSGTPVAEEIGRIVSGLWDVHDSIREALDMDEEQTPPIWWPAVDLAISTVSEIQSAISVRGESDPRRVELADGREVDLIAMVALLRLAEASIGPRFKKEDRALVELREDLWALAQRMKEEVES